MEKENMKWQILGIVLLMVAVIDSIHLIYTESPAQLLWYCNTILFLLSFGLFRKNTTVLSGILLSSLSIQLPWVIDFFFRLISDRELWGITTYLFDYGFSNYWFYVELDHLLILPLSALGTYALGYHKKGWAFAGLVGIVLGILSITFSSPSDNINCVYRDCFSSGSEPIGIWYSLAWILSFPAILFLMHQLYSAGSMQWKSDLLPPKEKTILR